MVKIAKEFRWEMGHRLKNHNGLCKNLHGHSYKMRIELEGEIDKKTSMLMDYYHLTKIVNQILEPFDHSFVVEKSDEILLNFLKNNNFKNVELDFVPTAENFCEFFTVKLKYQLIQYENIKKLTVRIYETNDVFAEIECFFIPNNL